MCFHVKRTRLMGLMFVLVLSTPHTIMTFLHSPENKRVSTCTLRFHFLAQLSPNHRLRAPFQHGVELATASGDLAGFVSRIGGIEPIIRGAAYARSQAVDVSFAAQVSVSSTLFNLPVEVIQRGRDHGEHYIGRGSGGSKWAEGGEGEKVADILQLFCGVECSGVQAT